MSSAAVIDDALVVRLLAGERAPTDLPVRTTVCWWWRLAAAVSAGRGGRLTAPLLAVDETHRAILAAQVARLDEILPIEDLRPLLPAASILHARFGLQLLAAEAAALAATVDAQILVGVDVPNLARAAEALGLDYRVAS